MADNRKLAIGLQNFTPAAREDMAYQAERLEQLKQADYLRKMGEQGVGLAKSVARGVPQMATGLVDLAAMPFEAAGVLQPGQAVGSTKWLENRGYLPEQQEGFLNQTAELLSGGFDPSDLVTKGAPLLMGIGKTVWHGSPHAFDKFDLSKIGTGEGAQAYGHGLYLAEARPTAEGYANDLSKLTYKVGNEVFDPSTLKHLNVRTRAWDGKLDEAIEKAKQVIQNNTPVSDLAKQDLAVLENIKAQGGLMPNEGNLYKVDLPDEHIAKMLDWDKPLSEQPDIQQAFVNHLVENQRLSPERASDFLKDKTAGEAYGTLSGRNNQEIISQSLLERGIPGIQYLDQASRGAGEGTRNYVVFSDEIPQILERNNQPVAQALREYKQLESLNPTGTVMTAYNPAERATLPLGKNLTTLDVTAGVSPDEMVEIYRGVPQGVSEISPGDFITTNRQLAQDYAGSGNVISQKVPYRTILDDLTEPLGEEYIYRP